MADRRVKTADAETQFNGKAESAPTQERARSKPRKQTHTGSLPQNITDEDSYFQAVRSFGALLDRKREVIDQLDTANNKANENYAGAVKYANDEVRRLARCLATVNRQLSDVDQRMRERIDRAVATGLRFAMENIANGRGLNHFERQVFAYFVYLEFQNGKDRSIKIHRSQLAELLDFSNAAAGQLRVMHLLASDNPLFTYKILTEDTVRNCPNYISLNPKALSAICCILAGGRRGRRPGTVQSQLADEPGEELEFDTRCAHKTIGILRKPRVTLDQVRIPEKDKDSIRMFLAAHTSPRLRELGVYDTITDAKGMVFLFYGPPGTGKTLLAEAVAGELKRKLVIVDLGEIVDKYVGESEKHIASMFAEAKKQDAVLLIDEADSLLMNRTEVRHEHGIRCVNAMLCELQRCESVVILTSNMVSLIDGAVERRIALKLEFKHPDLAARAEIWHKHIPPRVGVSDDVDLNGLAKRYNFAGGNIKNAVLNALRRMVLDRRECLTAADLDSGATLERDGMFANKDTGRHITGFASVRL